MLRLLTLSAALCVVHAIVHGKHGVHYLDQEIGNENLPENVAPVNLTLVSGYYKQTVDHFGPRTGVNGSWFNQFYFVQDLYYKPGGPIFFYVSGESTLTRNSSGIAGGTGRLLSWLLPKYNGLAVTLEHRFYGAEADAAFPGRSVPTADLSLESLELLRVEQVLADNAQFIRDFPSLFPQYNIRTDAKWITIGGSYAGLLSAWMRQLYPDLVYASHASSAPVLTELDGWKYSYGVDSGFRFQANMRFNNGDSCLKGWTRAIRAFDTTLANVLHDTNKLDKFKAAFWMSQVKDVYDIAKFLVYWIPFSLGVQYTPISATVNNVTALDLICDGKHYPAFTNEAASDEDLLQTLNNLWIEVMKTGFTGDDDVNIGKTFNTVKQTQFKLTDMGASKLWAYQVCNELGMLQTAQPIPNGLVEEWSVYSQFDSIDNRKRECDREGLLNAPIEDRIAEYRRKFDGRKITRSNILWVNGEYDPWRQFSYSRSTPGVDQDLLLYRYSSHCNDLWGPMLAGAPDWRIISAEYEISFFEELFAVYDKWIYGDSD